MWAVNEHIDGHGSFPDCAGAVSARFPGPGSTNVASASGDPRGAPQLVEVESDINASAFCRASVLAGRRDARFVPEEVFIIL
jgi:hypothetical protein